MRIISIIEDQEIIGTVLQHLGLWDIRSRSLAMAHAPPAPAAAEAALPHNTPICGDPQYPWEAYP